MLFYFAHFLNFHAAPAFVRMKPSKLGQFLHFYVTSRLILFLEGAALFNDAKLVKTLVWYGTVTG